MTGWDAELADGFAPAVPAAYTPIGELARQVFGPRALIAPPEMLACGPPVTPAAANKGPGGP